MILSGGEWGPKAFLGLTSASCSPQQAELPFRAGDVITVFGDMDNDGFYYVRPLWGSKVHCTPRSAVGQAMGKGSCQKSGGISWVTSLQGGASHRLFPRVLVSRGQN